MTAFVVGNAVDHFRVYDDCVEHNQVGNEQPYTFTFIPYVERWSLAERNFSKPKLYGERILLRFLDDAVSECIQYLDRTTNDLEDLILEQQLLRARVHQGELCAPMLTFSVHSCPFVVMAAGARFVIDRRTTI